VRAVLAAFIIVVASQILASQILASQISSSLSPVWSADRGRAEQSEDGQRHDRGAEPAQRDQP
jgi:hypothetical protein